jgi:hypothetical protein
MSFCLQTVTTVSFPDDQLTSIAALDIPAPATQIPAYGQCL